MNRIKSIRGLVYWLLPVMLFGCATPMQQVRVNRNLSYLYIPGRTPLRPEYRVYHDSDSSSVLRIKIQPLQLLFNQANKDGKFLNMLSIRYRLYEVGRQRRLADSGRVQYTIDLEQLRGDFRANILLSCQIGSRYILETITSDLVRKTAVQHFLAVDKQNNHTAQDFRVTEPASGLEYFSDVLDSSKRFQIHYRMGNPDTWHVSYYSPDTLVPPPPDLMVGSPPYGGESDSSWVISTADTSGLRLPKSGVYLIRADSIRSGGLPLYNFGAYYPRIRTPEQMVGPLAYLLNPSELAQLKSSENLKLAIDKFWLGTSDNIEKSRELIRIFYNRVYYANLFFTSYKEGWRTDRGMIYVIYGPPDELRKTPASEVWKYGEEKSEDKLVFTFSYQEHPLSQNHYVLRRGENVESRWRQAVRTWRQGNVFVVGKS